MSLVLPDAPSYPWLLGTTSFVLPAGLEENVSALAGRVDCVQLLFFESEANSLLEHRLDVPFLQGLAAEHGLAYTVHLPLDIRLGSGDRRLRQQGVEEICRRMEELSPLEPLAFDLHLAPEQELDSAVWRQNLFDSLTDVAGRVAEWRARIGVENIGYDFELVADLVLACGFGICVDFGHRLRYNHQTDFWAMPCWRHIHLHGAGAGRDHRPFRPDDADFLRRFGEKLVNRHYHGVVTLELYELAGVCDSLAMLHEAWQPFQQGERL